MTNTDIHEQGVRDGYDGEQPSSEEADYLIGYREGWNQFQAEVDMEREQAQAEDEQAHWEQDAEYAALYFSDVEQGMYDDDPSPYAGDYSEM
jgi:hypothetical protein